MDELGTAVANESEARQYPDSREARLEVESQIYDTWYQKNECINKPFFYHDPTTERRFVKSLISRFELIPGSKLLDIGCGNGFYSRQFQKHGFVVTGVDISATAIEYCRANFDSKCTWLKADAFSLGFQEEFNYGFGHFFTYFNQFDNPDDGIESATTLMHYLRPGGRLYFVWISDLSAIRLPEKRFSIMNFTLQQFAGFFPDYRATAYAMDSRARLPLLLGKFAFSKYVTRLSCATVQLMASTWRRVRIVLEVCK
jgi:SAM-dependent methyltransferase